MALTSSNAVKQLSDQNSQGTVLGATTADLVGFYGVTTPISQPTISGSGSSGTLGVSIAGALHNLGLCNSTGAAD
jgi:hypothetical protein